ncbi:YdcF family protein [Thalassiella azotivora]
MGVLRLLRAALLLVVLGVVALVAVTAARVLAHSDEDDRRPSDAIVVLGAAQFNGRPGPYLEPRLEHALALYEQGVAPAVVTTGGGQPGEEFTEAEAGRDWLVDRGVPQDAVVVVARGVDTRGSLWAAAAEMRDRGWETAVVVTDPWHSLRSTEMLRHQGVDAVSSPTTSGPSTAGGWSTVTYTARETAAYLHWIWLRVTT